MGPFALKLESEDIPLIESLWFAEELVFIPSSQKRCTCSDQSFVGGRCRSSMM
uniref:Uncharacterized protein n=1 Tax=Nelumbo nucifera TaxID=4432 RepID=A0A822YTG1_NELNU|nr:TPA_asm: hypothetical protein HUJ06_011369 [Nelumbo nucifera]